jgi:hypothetical protein
MAKKAFTLFTKKDPGETPADRAADKKAGIKEGSKADLKKDSGKPAFLFAKKSKK